jgi:hypothetical protein
LLKYVFNVRVDEKKEVFGRTDLEHLFRQAKEAEEEKQPLNTEFFENALELPKDQDTAKPRSPKRNCWYRYKRTVDAIRRIFIETKLSRIVVLKETLIISSVMSINSICSSGRKVFNQCCYPFPLCRKV